MNAELQIKLNELTRRIEALERQSHPPVAQDKLTELEERISQLERIKPPPPHTNKGLK